MPKILLVDDSRSIRHLVSQALISAGHEVHEAGDGEEGLAAAGQHSFDLVLTDLNMPVMSGIEMTRGIRSLAGHSQTPILLVTTESQLKMKEQAKAAGATGWVVKPIPPQRLLEIVSKVLDKAAAI